MQGIFSLSTSTPLNRQMNKKIVRILHALLQMPQSIPFRKPVPHKALKLDDYRNIIKKPMDLNLIRRQNNQSKYKIVEQILDDIQLCWDNCKLYNAAQSQIYRQAQFLESQFFKMIKDNFPELVQNNFEEILKHQTIQKNQYLKEQNIAQDMYNKKQNYQKKQLSQKLEDSVQPQILESMDKQQQEKPGEMQPQEPELPPPEPIMVNLKLTPTFQQILQLSKVLKQSDKNTLEQVLQILYTNEKQLLRAQNHGQIEFSMTKVHYSTYLKICKTLKLLNGDNFIQ